MIQERIIGRKKEFKILSQIVKLKEAQFIAVYGRRRVGKTFLIREFYKDKGFFLECTGIKNLELSKQLANFSQALSKTFFSGAPLKISSSWHEAFELLTQKIQEIPKGKKAILFLDELPWLASRRSGLIQALDYYWNVHWSKLNHLILIVCGSAASWMLEHIVNAKGGLYNRISKKIMLEPFNLKETKEFLKAQTVKLEHKQIVDLYMAIGGIPYYLKEVRKGESASQAIDGLCFQNNGILYTEFKHLFRSLFDHAENHLQIIREIANAGNTISRERLIAATKMSSGGSLNRRLEELEASGFIKHFIPLGKKSRDSFYRIIDEYTLFYLKWIEPLISSGTFSGKKGYWNRTLNTPHRNTWAGFAFESLCIKHIDQIIQAIGIEDIAHKIGCWRFVPARKSKDQGAQVDLLFDRADGIITLCEVKFSEHVFTIDKAYSGILNQKIDAISKHYPNSKNPTKKQIQLAMATTYGIKKNMYSEELVQNVITLNELFVD